MGKIGVDNAMTIEERFGSFAAYQKDQAEKALAYQQDELNVLKVAARGGNDYAVRQNIGHDEVIYRMKRAENAIEYLTKLIESDGKIQDPVYLAYWNHLKHEDWIHENR